MPLSPDFRWQIAEAGMRSLGIVADAPLLNSLSGFFESGEPFLIQALLSKTPVERLDLSILRGLARLDKEQGHVVLLGPDVK